MLNNSFQKYLLISLGAHLVVFAIVIFSPNFERKVDTNAKVKWIKLSRGDGGTNIKANDKNLDHMPKNSLKDQKKALKDQSQAVENTKTPSQKNETGKTIPITDSQKQADPNGGKNLAKKTPPKDNTDELIANALKRTAEQQQQRKIEVGSAQAKEGDTGQSLQGGDEGSELGTELILYYSQVRQKISKEWVIIKSEFSGALVARIIVRIDVNGNVITTNFKQSSGDGSFDESAMRAVRKSAPFPIQPKAIQADLTQDGFEFVFNPKTVAGSAM